MKQPGIHDIAEAIYRQWRVNRARSEHNQLVEIMADRKHADKFHAMLKRWALSCGGFPKPIKWIEHEVPLLGMQSRQYVCDRFPMLGLMDGLDLRVLIPEGYDCIFTIPDFVKWTYCDLITMKTHKFPKVKK